MISFRIFHVFFAFSWTELATALSGLSALTDWIGELLTAVGILLLLSVAGGQRIRIRDLQLGPIGKKARWIAGGAALAISVLTFFSLVVSAPQDRIVAIRGQYHPIGVGRAADDRKLELRFIPYNRFQKIPVQTGTQRFLIPREFETKEGMYTAILYNDGNPIAETIVLIDPSQELIVNRLQKSRISATSGQMFGNLVKMYRSSPNWKRKLQAVKFLGSLAESDMVVRGRVEEMYAGQNALEKELAAFALGEMCEDRPKKFLRGVMETDENFYRRIQAAGYLLCSNDSELKEIANRFLLETVSTGQDRYRSAAASYYARRTSTRYKCVAEHLIRGLEKGEISLNVERKYILSSYTGQDFDTTEEWKAWAKEGVSRYKEC